VVLVLDEVKGEPPPEEVLRNPKLVLFNLLRVLKFFYSFKALERRLGVPSQVLWRYVTLRATPERETAQRLISRIRELKLVEEAVQRTLAEGRELWMVFSNPGVLELTALRALDEFRKARVDVVLAASDAYSAALAALVATHMRARLCVPSTRPLTRSVIVEARVDSSGSVEAVALPRGCIPRRSRVLLAASLLDEGVLETLAAVASRAGAEVEGVVAIAARGGVEDALAGRGLRKAKALIMIRLEDGHLAAEKRA
jgi:hypothetical protein